MERLFCLAKARAECFQHRRDSGKNNARGMNYGISFSDAPQQRTHDDYNRVRNKYIRYVAETSALISVYQYGNVAVPGFSDLDLVLVLHETPPRSRGYNFSVRSLDKLDRYTMAHNPRILDRYTFSRWNLFLEDRDLKCVYGHEIRRQPIPPHKRDTINFVSLMEWIVTNVHWLSQLAFADHIKIRQTANILNSICHSIRVAAELGIPTLEWWDEFNCGVQEFREQWFRETDPLPLVGLIESGFAVLISIAKATDLVLRQRFYNDEEIDTQQPYIFFHSANSATIFEEEFEEFYRSYANLLCLGTWLLDRGMGKFSTACSLAALPISFGHYLYLCSCGTGWCSKYLRDHLPDSDRRVVALFSQGFSAIVEERGAVAEWQIDFLRRYGLNYGALGGFGVREPILVGNDLVTWMRRRIINPAVFRRNRGRVRKVIERHLKEGGIISV